MGSICVMVLCLARDHRTHCWHRYSGTNFSLRFCLSVFSFYPFKAEKEFHELVSNSTRLINSVNLGEKAYAGSQTLQSIILLCTGTNKDGGYFAPKWLFLCMYMGLTAIWAVLNTFALEVIAFIDVISIWWQVFPEIANAFSVTLQLI